MGWVKEHKKDEGVKGIIVAGKFDEKLKYAKTMVPNSEAFLYEVDFKIKEYSTKKIKKNDDSLKLEFTKNIDVVSTIANHKNRPKLVVSFALESDNYEVNAKSKLINKNVDLVVVNKAKYLGKDFNEFSMCSTNSYKELGSISKKDLAKDLVDTLEGLLGKKS